MHSSNTLNRRLRASCMALCLSAVGSSWAQLPFAQFGGVFPFSQGRAQQQQGPSARSLGAQAEDRRDFPAALTHYERALFEASNSPPMFKDEMLRQLLPRLARVYMALSKLAEADTAMQLLASLPPPQLPSNGGTSFAEVMQALGSAMKIAKSGATSINQRLYFDGEGAEQLDAALAFRLPATEIPSVLWAELRARQGRHAEVLRLWREDFQEYRQNADRHLEDGRMVLINDEVAVAAWHMALSLQAGGAFDEAQQALALALDMNRTRLQFFAAQSSLLEAQLAGFQQHRWLAASAMQLAIQSGNTAHQRFALGAWASANGLTNRFLKTRRALLAQMDDRASRRALSELKALDLQLLQLPTSGADGIKASVDWTNSNAAVLNPVMPALAKAGLPQIIVDGAAMGQRVQQALTADEALIGYLQYQPIDPLTLQPGAWRTLRYTLVGANLSIKDLGLKRPLDLAVGNWRQVDNAQAQRAAAASLSSSLLGQLPDDVVKAKSWVIAADGQLALLPFEALPDAAKGLVLDKHSVRYLSQLAQLADQVAHTTALSAKPRNGAVIVADPVYTDGAPSANAFRLPTILTQGQAWRDMKFQALPETRAEAAAVAQALQLLGVNSQIMLGKDATPEALLQVDAPAFLHIAGHGFMLSPAPELDVQTNQRVRMLVPGLLSGLMLSPGARGPVLTGTDLASLNLRGTRLVVLSACDTGNGSVDAFEGLTSLRRAVEEAGARASVTSLWPVPSNATVKLMTLFYRQLAAGQSNSAALRSAKLSMRDAGGNWRDWAGFVLAGAER